MQVAKKESPLDIDYILGTKNDQRGTVFGLLVVPEPRKSKCAKIDKNTIAREGKKKNEKK